MTSFKIHTPETAPEKSRDILKAVHGKFGFVPNVLGEMAESPALLKGYVELSETVKTGHFSPIEQQIVQMTASWMNGCDYCVAAHSTVAQKEKLPVEIITALREDSPLKDAKLESLRQFTKIVLKKMGRADERDIETFIKAGYTHAHVYEVVLGLSLKFITNYVNHIVKTPLDKAFEPNKFEGKTESVIRTSCAA